MNAVNNMLLRANMTPADEELFRTGIAVTNHPMNRTAKQMASFTLYDLRFLRAVVNTDR